MLKFFFRWIWKVECQVYRQSESMGIEVWLDDAHAIVLKKRRDKTLKLDRYVLIDEESGRADDRDKLFFIVRSSTLVTFNLLPTVSSLWTLSDEMGTLPCVSALFCSLRVLMQIFVGLN